MLEPSTTGAKIAIRSDNRTRSYDYLWTCLVCRSIYDPRTAECHQCGCPAYASVTQMDTARIRFVGPMRMHKSSKHAGFFEMIGFEFVLEILFLVTMTTRYAWILGAILFAAWLWVRFFMARQSKALAEQGGNQ